nr:uncharacterized protein LOC106623288 isoform X2 [Bactrocera oleae]
MSNYCFICTHLLTEGQTVTVNRGMKTLINASIERDDGFSKYLIKQKSVTIHEECHKNYTRKCSIAVLTKRKHEEQEASTYTRSSGVLKFLLDHTKNEDVEGPKSQEMDVEKKQFLESALNTMTTDVMKEFQMAIFILENQESTVADKVKALHIIRESIDDIDFANSFVNAGGSVYLVQNLNHIDCEIRILTAYIIAEMSQNNPVCQKHFVDAKTIPALIRYLNQSNEVANSSLHAISSLLQNFEPGIVEFLNVDGIQILLSCLDVSNAKMFERVCFLIGKLAEREDLRDELIEKSAIIRLIKCLPVSFDAYNSSLETALYALSELSKSNKWMIEESQEGKLKELATSVTENITSVEEYGEVYRHSCAILRKLETHTNSR